MNLEKQNTNFASQNNQKQHLLFETGIGIIGEKYALPTALSVRTEHITMIATLLLSVSFIVVALARLNSKHFVLTLAKAIFKNKQIDKIVQEEYPLNNLASILLLVNYLVSSTAVLFLCLPYKYSLQTEVLLLLLPIPFLVFFLPWFSLNVISVLVGDSSFVSESKKNTVVLTHFLGLFYSFILLFWTFNTPWRDYFIAAFLAVTLLSWVFRFFRGFLFAIHKGASWYYIILYFCTLEIIPFILIFILVNVKLKENIFWLFN